MLCGNIKFHDVMLVLRSGVNLLHILSHLCVTQLDNRLEVRPLRPRVRKAPQKCLLLPINFMCVFLVWALLEGFVPVFFFY